MPSKEQRFSELGIRRAPQSDEESHGRHRRTVGSRHRAAQAAQCERKGPGQDRRAHDQEADDNASIGPHRLDGREHCDGEQHQQHPAVDVCRRRHHQQKQCDGDGEHHHGAQRQRWNPVASCRRGEQHDGAAKKQHPCRPADQCERQSDGRAPGQPPGVEVAVSFERAHLDRSVRQRCEQQEHPRAHQSHVRGCLETVPAERDKQRGCRDQPSVPRAAPETQPALQREIRIELAHDSGPTGTK